MPDLKQVREFVGSLSNASGSIPVRFRANIEPSGEMRFDFDDLDYSSAFVRALHGGQLNARLRLQY